MNDATRRLWIDDLRPMPKTWITMGDYWATTSNQAINYLRHVAIDHHTQWDEISFDHDLGGDDTTRRVMLWMVEHDVWPKKIVIHTANPVGRDWLAGTARSYAPEGTVIVA